MVRLGRRGVGWGGWVCRRQHGILIQTGSKHKNIRPKNKFSSTSGFLLLTSKGPLLAGPTAPSQRHGSGRDPRAQELPTRKSVRRLRRLQRPGGDDLTSIRFFRWGCTDLSGCNLWGYRQSQNHSHSLWRFHLKTS